jgi:hypothetical protein
MVVTAAAAAAVPSMFAVCFDLQEASKVDSQMKLIATF